MLQALAAVALLAAAVPAAAATLEAQIDLSDQQMTVRLDGTALYSWPVSTARAGKVTPTGLFVAEWLSRNHRSSIYDDAPMPWSIFFNGNYAIHGTTEISRLGTPASAGCVRLHPDNARILFELAREVGLANTYVLIVP